MFVIYLFNSAPSQPAVSKIISTAPDLQPKQPAADNSAADIVVGEGNEEGEPEEDEGEGGDSDSDEDDVEITIGEITTAPGSYSRTPNYGRMGLGAGGMKALNYMFTSSFIRGMVCICRNW